MLYFSGIYQDLASKSDISMKPLLTMFLGILCLLSGGTPNAPAGEPSPAAADKANLTSCIDKNLGFKIKCSPNWSRDARPHELLFLIENKPNHVVVLTVAKFQKKDLELKDLTPIYLRSRFHYTHDFKMGDSQIAGRKAIVAIAQPLGYPGVQLLDYYVVKGADLYRISFSVNTRNRYKDYEPLFSELIHSFEFLPVEESTLSLSHGPTLPEPEPIQKNP